MPGKNKKPDDFHYVRKPWPYQQSIRLEEYERNRKFHKLRLIYENLMLWLLRQM